MAIEILMPALSPTMTEGNLARWLKKEGDKVAPGEVIAEIETDKATMEVEAVDEGVLAKIIIPEATEGVKVNQLIAVLLEDGEDAASIEVLIANQNNMPQESTVVQGAPVASMPQLAEQSTTQSISENRVFATPLARRLAAEKNLDLSKVTGSGPHGRIIKNDVIGLANNNSFVVTPQSVEPTSRSMLVPFTAMRKIIAKRLQESKQNIPHFYLDIDCNVDKLLQLRTEINKNAPLNVEGKPKYRISVNDMMIKACALALQQVPEANVAWSEQGLIQHHHIDISVAVAIDGGLITPILPDADKKSITEISALMQQLVIKAKQNQLKPEEFQGGSFSISNLGMYGIKNFKAIINPPQACILAVGATTQVPVVKDGGIQIASVMSISLSCDHRVIDGAVAATFLNKLQFLIENPVNILV
jgi:pyruvate dehydrogenase E2 component (dihydrolipoamide acetyltransferase)